MYNVSRERRLLRLIDAVTTLYAEIREELIPEMAIPLMPLLGADTFNVDETAREYGFQIHDTDIEDSVCMLLLAPILDGPDGIIINFMGSIVMPLHNVSRLIMAGVTDDEFLFIIDHTLRHECGHAIDLVNYVGLSYLDWSSRSSSMNSDYTTLKNLRVNASAKSIFDWYVRYHSIEAEAIADRLGGVSVKDYAIDFVLANKEVPYSKLGVDKYLSKKECDLIKSGKYRYL